MDRYYINTYGPDRWTVIPNEGERFEDLDIPYKETWNFKECNILEYWLWKHLGINERVGDTFRQRVRNEFNWFPARLRQLWRRN